MPFTGQNKAVELLCLVMHFHWPTALKLMCRLVLLCVFVQAATCRHHAVAGAAATRIFILLLPALFMLRLLGPAAAAVCAVAAGVCCSDHC